MPNQPNSTDTTNNRTPGRSEDDMPKGQVAVAQPDQGEQTGCCGEADGVEDEDATKSSAAGNQKQNDKRSDRSAGSASPDRGMSENRKTTSDQSRQAPPIPVGAGTDERE